ncbi:hypothetical protein jhhlp_001306 [Lomentospora prolificans]|uniref:Uncharacterized protein n=1 Tax=Lomentospora prolificans TaxID=41688 RepID=A0A2N3NHV3_9PEZI|nr:hypothetical protein jhhlp_001306 [Lomentospora prolificans]
MSNSPAEAAHQPGQPPAINTTDLLKARPAHITRSVSDIQSAPAKFHSSQHAIARERQQQQQEDRPGQSSTHPYPYASRGSLDIPPTARSETFSSNPETGRGPAGVAMAPKVDESVSGPGLRKASNERKPLKDWQQVTKTVTGLKQCIVDLNEVSSDTTQRLDKTYYSVLEKIGTLQSTILGLKELAIQSQKTAETFDKDTHEVAKEVESQLNGFGHFRDQENRIEALRERIDASRKKISALSGRVDVVKDRVEGWERADKEWQERTRRRLKTFWAITSIVFLVLALLYLGAPYAASVPEPPDQPANEAVVAKELGETPETAPSSSSSGIAPGFDVSSMGDQEQRLPNLTRRSEVGGKDERLRVFDEL